MGQVDSIPMASISVEKPASAQGLPLDSPPSNPTPKPISLPVSSKEPPDKGESKFSELQGDEDEDVSRYTVDADETLASMKPGSERHPPRIGTLPAKKPKARWFSCCRKNKESDVDVKKDDELESKTLEILRSYSRGPMAASTLPSVVPLNVNASVSPNPELYSTSGSAAAGPIASTHTTAATKPAEAEEVGSKSLVQITESRSRQPRRTRIPNRPDISMSLWGIIRNALGKDLTKLPLPVNFNEPLSMLQRLTEDFEYSSVLDKAASILDSCEQMTYVAAFTVSSYASTAVRTGKPFNPLLGETFECDRISDLGWRCLCEQVSHHPPTAAQHCYGRNWVCWQEFTMSSKFRGNYIEVAPSGIAHLVFTESGNHYTWRKVTTVVHNLIVGKLWVDQEGEMDILNHTTGDSCHLTYITNNIFRGEAKRVEGKVLDKDSQPKFTVAGYWDRKLESFEVLKVDAKDKLVLGPVTLLWSRNMPALESEKYYNFTVLACQLNEFDDSVAPTDSRRRTDQRLMENGLFDEANNEKLRLEEKQRAVRKQRLADIKSVRPTPKPSATAPVPDSSKATLEEEDGEPGFQACWFSHQKDSITGKPIHMFAGDYWNCKDNKDWSRCPDIYGPS